MRVWDTSELARLTRTELRALLAKMLGEMSDFPAGSPEHAMVHANLRNIRCVLTMRGCSPG